MTNQNNYCNRCINRIVLHAFSTGKCIICKIKTDSPHIPADVVCNNCSKQYDLCMGCGEQKL